LIKVGTFSKSATCWLLVEVTEDRLDDTVEVDLLVAKLLLEDAVVTEAMLPFATSLGRVMMFLQYLSAAIRKLVTILVETKQSRTHSGVEAALGHTCVQMNQGRAWCKCRKD
jgi:hypothetical protein